MEWWYVLRTKANSENKGAAAPIEGGIKTYLPEIEASKAHQNEKDKVCSSLLILPCLVSDRSELWPTFRKMAMRLICL